MTILEELQWRGLFADCTALDALTRRLSEGALCLYAGFDPTADSLHVGNLVPLLALRRFQDQGHHPIALAGGATGMIGDPSGKSAERNLQTADQIEANIATIRDQLAQFLDFDNQTNPARLVDNFAWTSPCSYLEFLRDVGKHFPVNLMLAKDSVRTRLEEGGISYTEFSYMLLQAHDFYHLRTQMDCELQVGATDQWGNITAGTEFIRRKSGATAWGLTFPLLTKSDGTKYGKSADGTIWLDPRRTTPYRFYQFFQQAEDADVIKLLRMLTFLSAPEIEALAAAREGNPGGRAAQNALAEAVTTLVHGKSLCEDARRASQILFGGDFAGVSEGVFQDVVDEVPTVELPAAHLAGKGTNLVNLVVASNLGASRNKARSDIAAGGIYVNNERSNDINRNLTTVDLLFGKYLLLRKGKRNYVVLKFGS